MKLQPPQVSIITIFLNEANYIEEAIQSALDQEYANWELLLVDDGSTDDSTQIARTYAEKYPEQIHYLEHEGHANRGMSASRNLGIQQAHGSYLAFLDADDVWLPNKLQQQVQIMETRPEAALICGRTQWWYSWTGRAEDQDKDFLQQFKLELDQVIDPPQVLLLFLQDEWASLCDVLVRRELVTAVGGYEDLFRGMYEDQAFHAKLCLQYPVYLADHCWYRYRQHPQACTSESHKNGQSDLAREKFLLWLEAYLKQHGAEHTPVWQLVQQRLWPFRHPRLYRMTSFIRKLIE